MGVANSRLGVRIAAATALLTVLLSTAMGGGAWLAGRSMLRSQAQALTDETARARAALASHILSAISADISSHALLDRGGFDDAVLTADLSRAAGLLVNVMVVESAAAPLQGGLRAGPEGWIEGVFHSGEMGNPAFVWRVKLAELARRLALEKGMPGLLSARDAGGLHEIAYGPAGSSKPDLLGTADIVLPPGIIGGVLSVKAVGDASLWASRLRTLELWLWGMGGAGIIVAVAASISVGRHLTKRLMILADSAESYSVGKGEGALPVLKGDDEIARLSKSLAAMTARLDSAYRDLDARSQTLLSNAERVAQVGSAVWLPFQDKQIWSDQFHAVLGLSPGDVTPSRNVFFDRIHPADREEVAAAVAKAMNPCVGRLSREFRIIRADGIERMVQFRAQMAFDADDRVERVDATLQDITERKSMEVQLDDLVRELKRSNEELEQFAYAASHDLRQPLRTVRSYVGLMEDSLNDKLDAETREFMGFIRDGVLRMDALITGLLTYSRVGRGVADGPVDSGRMVDLALLDLQAQIEESEAEIVVDGPMPVLEGDAGELTRLFQNLIGNALKYRSPTAPPRIRVQCRDDGGSWRFSVCDNGIGIAADQRDRVFGIFQRLHGRHEYEGAGIGLAVCRKMVERCGGQIWVEDNDLPDSQGGCAFRFTWPKLKRSA